MRAISLKQPWASLTAAGIRDVEVSNRDTNYRGPVLLHASSRRVGRSLVADTPTEQLCRLRNAQTLGVVPYDEEVPLSSIVGVAQLVDCIPQMVDSPWSKAGNNWILRDARLFTEPITGIKGKQGLFDVPELNEANLPPSYEAMPLWSEYHDGVFRLSMTDREIERQIPDWPIVLLLCDDGLAKPALNPGTNHALQPIHELQLVSPSQTHTYPNTTVTLLEEEVGQHRVKYIAFNIH